MHEARSPQGREKCLFPDQLGFDPPPEIYHTSEEWLGWLRAFYHVTSTHDHGQDVYARAHFVCDNVFLGGISMFAIRFTFFETRV